MSKIGSGASEEKSFENVNVGTHGQTDDGRKVITIAHPEHSLGELKIEDKKKMIVVCKSCLYVEGLTENNSSENCVRHLQGCKIPLAQWHLQVNFKAGQVRFSKLSSLFCHF